MVSDRVGVISTHSFKKAQYNFLQKRLAYQPLIKAAASFELSLLLTLHVIRPFQDLVITKNNFTGTVYQVSISSEIVFSV